MTTTITTTICHSNENSNNNSSSNSRSSNNNNICSSTSSNNNSSSNNNRSTTGGLVDIGENKLWSLKVKRIEGINWVPEKVRVTTNVVEKEALALNDRGMAVAEKWEVDTKDLWWNRTQKSISLELIGHDSMCVWETEMRREKDKERERVRERESEWVSEWERERTDELARKGN